MTGGLLLDTHAFVWWATGSPALPPATIELISSSTDVRVSLVSLWEIVLKESTSHPMVGTDDCLAWFTEAVVAAGFQILGVAGPHIGGVQRLPPHHRDPFDRLLIAQAVHERLTLVTRDRKLAVYPVPLAWAD